MLAEKTGAGTSKVGSPMTNCFQTAIREFLKVRTSYDVLPLSFRLIMLDNDLLIRTCLNILMQNCTLLTTRARNNALMLQETDRC